MRTTLNIDEDLLVAYKELATSTHQSLSHVIQDALREALTLRRTGAASALASGYLSRRDARRLLVVGTGALAPTMAEAHCAVNARPIRRMI